jgi:hypothetical protein
MEHKFRLYIQKDKTVHVQPTESKPSFGIVEVQSKIGEHAEIANAIIYVSYKVGRYYKSKESIESIHSQIIARFKALGFALIMGEVPFAVFTQQWSAELNKTNSHSTTKKVIFESADDLDFQFSFDSIETIEGTNDFSSQFLQRMKDSEVLFSAEVIFVWMNTEKRGSKAYKDAINNRIFPEEPERTSIISHIYSLFSSPHVDDKTPFFLIQTNYSFDELVQRWPQKKKLRWELYEPDNGKIETQENQTTAAVVGKMNGFLKREYSLSKPAYKTISDMVGDGSRTNLKLRKNIYFRPYVYYFCETYPAINKENTAKILAFRKIQYPNHCDVLFIFGTKSYEAFCAEAETTNQVLLHFEANISHVSRLRSEFFTINPFFRKLNILAGSLDIFFTMPTAVSEMEEKFNHALEYYRKWYEKFGEDGYEMELINTSYEYDLSQAFNAYQEAMLQICLAMNGDLKSKIIERIKAYKNDQFWHGGNAQFGHQEVYSDHQSKINTFQEILNALDNLTELAKAAQKIEMIGIAQYHFTEVQRGLIEANKIFSHLLENDWCLIDGEKLKIVKKIEDIKVQSKITESSSIEMQYLQQRLEELTDYEWHLKMLEGNQHYTKSHRQKRYIRQAIKLRLDLSTIAYSHLQIQELTFDEQSKLISFLKKTKEVSTLWAVEVDKWFYLEHLPFPSLKGFVNELMELENSLKKKYDIKNNFAKVRQDLSEYLFLQAMYALNVDNPPSFSVELAQGIIVNDAPFNSWETKEAVFFFALQQALSRCGIKSTVSGPGCESEEIIPLKNLGNRITGYGTTAAEQFELGYKSGTGHQLKILTPSQQLQEIILSDNFSSEQLKDHFQEAYIEIFEKKDRLEKEKPVLPLQTEIYPTKKKKSYFHIPLTSPLAPLASVEKICKPELLKKPIPFAWDVFFRALIAPIIDVSFLRSPLFWLSMVFLGVLMGFTLQAWAPAAFTLLAPYLMVFLSLSLCAGIASLLVCAVVEADKPKSTEAKKNSASEMIAYFKDRFAWMDKHRMLTAFSMAAVIGTVLGIIFIPETFFTELVHSICMIFLGTVTPLATEIISTVMLITASVLLPLLVGECILRIAVTATEVAEAEIEEDKLPTLMLKPNCDTEYSQIFTSTPTLTIPFEQESEKPSHLSFFSKCFTALTVS